MKYGLFFKEDKHAKGTSKHNTEENIRVQRNGIGNIFVLLNASKGTGLAVARGKVKHIEEGRLQMSISR